jgi:hypothetical protein
LWSFKRVAKKSDPAKKLGRPRHDKGGVSKPASASVCKNDSGSPRVRLSCAEEHDETDARSLSKTTTVLSSVEARIYETLDEACGGSSAYDEE